MKRISYFRFSWLAPLLALLLVQGGQAVDGPVDAAIAAYDNGEYRIAADGFKAAIKLAPQDSGLHHWLGKCYGRIAEHGNWFTALSYAKKTLKQFRLAVELDADNYGALRDLIDYLETAPGLLGGNRQEAENLRQRLDMLRHAREAYNE